MNKIERIENENDVTLSVGRGALSTAIRSVVGAISKDVTRSHINALRVEFDGKTLRFIATDGHRLHTSLLDLSGPKEEFSYAASLTSDEAKLLEKVVKCAKRDHDQALTVRLNGKLEITGPVNATFKMDHEISFPPWKQVLVDKGDEGENNAAGIAQYNAKYVSDAMKSAALLGDGVYWSMSKDALAPARVDAHDSEGVLESTAVIMPMRM